MPIQVLPVDPPGIEPGSPACRAGVVPLDHRPAVAVDRMGVEPITPTLQESVAPSVHASPCLPEVRPGIEPGPRPYHGRVLPEHLQTVASVIPAGIEPALSCTSRRRLRRWTTGSSCHSDRGGTRTHRHEALDLAAMPICVPGRGGSGSRTRQSRLMRPGRAYAHPQLQAPESNRARRAYETQLGTCRACNLSVTKGRLELPCPKGTTF